MTTTKTLRDALNEVRRRHLHPVTEADAFDAAIGDALNDAERTLIAALPAEPEQADEGLDLSERLAMALSAPGDSPEKTRLWWAGRNERAKGMYRGRAATLLEQAARLAPARDDTSGGASSLPRDV